MNQQSGKILALDFGTNSVGLACCDETRQVFFGKGVIRNYGSLHRLFAKIADLCREEGISTVVFGLPMGDSGVETEQTERYRGIAEKLQEFLGTHGANGSERSAPNIKVVFEDEAFSTVDALTADFGMDQGEREAMRKNLSSHEVAAMIILQRYLARKR